MIKKTAAILIFGAVICSAGFLHAANENNAAVKAAPCLTKYNFMRFNNGNFGEITFQKKNANAFTLKIKNTEKYNHAIALANINFKISGNDVLSFKLNGKAANGRAFVTPFILHNVKGKWKTAAGPNLSCSKETEQTVKLSLGKKFKLPKDAALTQIKFVLNTDMNPKDSITEIEISDVQISPEVQQEK